MELVGNIDERGRTRIAGWVGDLTNPAEPLLVMLKEGERLLHCTLACRPRHDLRPHFSDVRKGFSFDLTEIETQSGQLDLYVARLDQLPDAASMFQSTQVHSSLELSKARWRGGERAPDLTFGMMLTGTEFFDFISRYAAERPVRFGRVVEIGPGYGRLFRHAKATKVAFDHFLGLDISEIRVERLNKEFGSRKVEFRVADVMQDPFPGPFDTLLCSSTFEHFYPDCAPVLEHIRAAMSPDGVAFLDFPNFENDEGFSAANFAPETGEYVRYYSREEIADACTAAGLEVDRFEPVAFRAADAGSPGEDESDLGPLVVKPGGRSVAIRRFMVAVRHKV